MKIRLFWAVYRVQDAIDDLCVCSVLLIPIRSNQKQIIPDPLKQIAHDSGFYEIKLDPEAEKVLVHYDWPGNVRELSNLLERVASYLEKGTIYPCDLPFHLYRTRKDSIKLNRTSLRQAQGSAEERAILHALDSTKYNKAKAANLLGIHRSLLYKKMKKYDLPLKKG